ncbi:MAG: Acyl-CoA dehydrogenase [Amycolatopsis sp.]|uniref:acyl-CoA dehydrogenase family protein n=1 Tax=Amycolatopsis sp. TaxID=37632 RepID=UPI002637CB9A|nr:acyl-CoA dehydrogenase family protein [Amycolatopsis sp.]MCU1684043.1 Acyl-CoA dehydrogenase [Amycolatopsis sp.]
MSLIYNEDQKSLSQTVKRFVTERSPMPKVREVIDSPDAYSAKTWQGIASELGLAALTVPEEYDGVGGTQSDVAAALRELGAGLVPSPMLSSAILATGVLVALDDEVAKKELLPQLAGGRITGAVAVSEPGARAWIVPEPATTASGTGAEVTLSGTKTAVVNGVDADILLVHASGPDGVGLYLVAKNASGVTALASRGADPTIGMATVTFDSTPARHLSGDVAAALDTVADQANVAVSALQSGAIGACLAMQTEYAKIRYSFGQPIGAYQGVKHKIADLYTAHALADAQLRVATDAADTGAEGASAAITAARVLFNDLHFQAAMQNQLLHGGIGHTWEHDSHWYTKNALALSQLLGDQDFQRDRLAEKLGL